MQQNMVQTITSIKKDIATLIHIKNERIIRLRNDQKKTCDQTKKVWLNTTADQDIRTLDKKIRKLNNRLVNLTKKLDMIKQ